MYEREMAAIKIQASTRGRLQRTEAERKENHEAAMKIHISKLTTMYAAWKLDQGDKARKEVSMAKVQVAETLNDVIDTCIQLCGFV